MEKNLPIFDRKKIDFLFFVAKIRNRYPKCQQKLKVEL